MSFKVNKLFRKWSCFGGKRSTPEEEAQNRLRLNTPRIVITECKSASPSMSKKSSSSSSSDSMIDEVVEAEIMLRTDGEIHNMGLNIVVKCEKLDQTDGNDNEDLSLVRVTDVEVGSFAHGFGVRKGDVISKVNEEYCGGDVLRIKEAFLSQESDDLQMELLRKIKNLETGDTEILRMTISNATRIGGTTVDELEIIKVASSWSLGDSGVYFEQEQRKYFLQFASEGTPWVVNENNRLGLAKNLSESEVETSAKFCIHVYFSWPMPETGYPVVIQHVNSGRCVAMVNNDIRLKEVSQLEEVTDESILFIERVADRDAGGSNKTFQSVMNKAMCLGFDTQGSSGIGYAKPISMNCTKNIVFIATES